MNRLSRRTLLRGGAVAVGLPMLEAMLPRGGFANGATPPSRFVCAYMGTCTGGAALTNPAATGTFVAPLPASVAGMQGVSAHVSLLSSLAFPIYNSGTMPTAPGSALNAQHHMTISPALSGVTSQDGVAPYLRGTSADQLAADFLGAGSMYPSLQMRVQAASYNGQTGSSAQTNGMSCRKVGNTLSELLPISSPQRIFTLLFSGGGTTLPPPPVGALSKRKSVLDAVLADANRLTANVGADDKTRLDQHFTYIRQLEQTVSTVSDGGTVMPPASCSTLADPGADPAISGYGFGGWAQETARGNAMADLITYALACDLTRVVSWMLTHDQCWLNSANTSGSTLVSSDNATEIHNDSHFATLDIKAKNANWGSTLFARLVSNLAQRAEGPGTVLDRTFLSLVFAEGMSAHNKANLTFAVAGYPSRIHNGVHVPTNGAHPALVQLAGLQAIGMNVSQLGEVSGSIPGLMV